MFSGTKKEQREQVVAALRNTNDQIQSALRVNKIELTARYPDQIKAMGFRAAKLMLIGQLAEVNRKLVDELTRLDDDAFDEFERKANHGCVDFYCSLCDGEKL